MEAHCRQQPRKGFPMHLQHRRSISVLATTLAALAVGATPALAGEDDDDDGDTTAPLVSGGSGSDAGSTVPQGGVATGAGGTAAQGADATLLGLASGALVLIASGGGMVAVARRRES
jgi:hypothetical protein